MKSGERAFSTYRNFDTSVLTAEEIKIQEEKIKVEKLKKYGFILSDSKVVELSANDKECAIKNAIKQRLDDQ